jgi:hypothetical protein
MHTVVVVGIGVLVLALCTGLGHALGGTAGAARAALYFLPLWLLGSGLNMFLGVRSAGYGVAEELPVLFIVFAIPAITAGIIWWKLH